MCIRTPDELRKYLVNQLELDYGEAHDHGYEFHFSWLLILFSFIAWEMPEGAIFPNIDPSNPWLQSSLRSSIWATWLRNGI